MKPRLHVVDSHILRFRSIPSCYCLLVQKVRTRRVCHAQFAMHMDRLVCKWCNEHYTLKIKIALSYSKVRVRYCSDILHPLLLLLLHRRHPSWARLAWRDLFHIFYALHVLDVCLLRQYRVYRYSGWRRIRTPRCDTLPLWLWQSTHIHQVFIARSMCNRDYMILSTYRRLLSFRLSPPIYQYSVRITIIGNKKKLKKKRRKMVLRFSACGGALLLALILLFSIFASLKDSAPERCARAYTAINAT